MCNPRSRTLSAPAKLNLSLHIVRRRPDEYHDLRMVMQSVAFGDTVTVTIGTGEPLRVETNLSYLPNDENNLAAVAARRFSEATGADLGGLAIQIEKRTPVCAGLGGGSSDAAAVLRALNDLTGADLLPTQLASIGAAVGSDVPYCVVGGTALAEGRGEQLTLLPPLPPCHIVLCKPNTRTSTAALFAAVRLQRLHRRPDTEGLVAALKAGDLPGVARRMYNMFEDVQDPRRAAETEGIKSVLLGHGAAGAVLSGTGPTVFGLFEGPAAAAAAHEALRAQYADVFLTQPV